MGRKVSDEWSEHHTTLNSRGGLEGHQLSDPLPCRSRRRFLENRSGSPRKHRDKQKKNISDVWVRVWRGGGAERGGLDSRQ